MVEKFSNLKIKDYRLGDRNINLFQNGNHIINAKGRVTSQGLVHTFINRYKEFCQIYSLKQLIKCPTRLTCNTSSLIDHILTNSTETISQSSITDSGISNH